MALYNPPPRPCHLIACSVFKPALEYLLRDEDFSQVVISYIPSHLHLHPNTLKMTLLDAIKTVNREDISVFLLFGCCFPEIDGFCHEHNVRRIRGEHCYEIMLGWTRFQEIMKETAGTYFLEQDLIRNFKEYCIEPLELHDEEMRKLCLGHYRRLIYLQQPGDPDLNDEIEAISRLLKLPAETLQVTYTHLKRRLLDILAGGKDNT